MCDKAYGIDKLIPKCCNVTLFGKWLPQHTKGKEILQDTFPRDRKCNLQNESGERTQRKKNWMDHAESDYQNIC